MTYETSKTGGEPIELAQKPNYINIYITAFVIIVVIAFIYFYTHS